MSHSNIILGFYFSLPPNFSEKEAELAYKQSIQPLVTLLSSQPKLKVTLYFSGNLIAWLKKHHKESLFQINKLSSSKQIEYLISGYFEPALQLISSRSRAYQIEKHYTTIRDNIGAGVRPKGFWLNDGIWESSFPYLLNSMGFQYTFIDDSAFQACGFSYKDMFEPFRTEDQNRSLFVFPIIQSLSQAFGNAPLEEYFSNLKQLYNTHHEDFLTLFKNGFLLTPEDYQWISDFVLYCLEVDFRFILPKTALEKNRIYKTIYIPATVGESCAGKMFINKRVDSSFQLEQEKDEFFRRGYFRNFLIKYRESSYLYKRICYLESFLKTRPKSEQKQVIDIFSEGQSAYPLRVGDDAGVYDIGARQKSYAALISVEKILTKSNSLVEVDFDGDGLKEIFHYGPFLITLFHRRGATVRELDYLPRSFNYVNTFCDYDDQCQMGVFLRRGAACFQDFFMEKGAISSRDKVLRPGTFQYDLSDFLYNLESVSDKNRQFSFALSLPDHIEMRKEYTLKKNDVIVEYQFYSTSNQNHYRYFGTELNLSFPNCSLCSVRKDQIQVEQSLEHPLRLDDVHELKISDPSNDTQLTLSFRSPCTIFTEAIYAKTTIKGEEVSLYQHVSIKILWKLDLKAESSWVSAVTFNIVRGG